MCDLEPNANGPNVLWVEGLLSDKTLPDLNLMIILDGTALGAPSGLGSELAPTHALTKRFYSVMLLTQFLS